MTTHHPAPSRPAGTGRGEFVDAWFVAGSGLLTLIVGFVWMQVALWFMTDDHSFWGFVMMAGGIAALVVTAFEVIAGLSVWAVVRRRRSLSLGTPRLMVGVLGALPALLFELGLIALHANPILHLVNAVVWAVIALAMFAALKEFATERPT